MSPQAINTAPVIKKVAGFFCRELPIMILLSILILLSVSLATALSPKFIDCQLRKASGVSPLQGCPPGTIYVSASDLTANFTSIQSAVASL
jgi:hypothetical protein